MRPLRRLLPFLLCYPVRLALTVAFLLIAAIASLAVPALAGRIVDDGFIAQNLDNVARYGWIVIVIGVVPCAAHVRRSSAPDVILLNSALRRFTTAGGVPLGAIRPSQMVAS